MNWTEQELKAVLAKGKVKMSPSPSSQPMTIAASFGVDSKKKKKGSKYWNVPLYEYESHGQFFALPEKDEKKYGRVVNYFASHREYSRCVELRKQEKKGLIKDLNLQYKLLLEDAGEYNGKKLRREYYLADFFYTRVSDGKQVVEDAKGFDSKQMCFRTTALFRSKWNRLKKKYPHYEFVLVDQDANQFGV